MDRTGVTAMLLLGLVPLDQDELALFRGRLDGGLLRRSVRNGYGRTLRCIDDDACLTVEPKKHFYQWHDERRHRVATRNRHGFFNRLSESFPAWANLLFYAAAVLLVLRGMLPWVAVVAAIAVKWAWQIVSFSRLTKRFDGGYVHFAAPLLEIYFIIANTILILLPLPNNRKFKK